ncbi:MAG: hypothetical protein ACOY0T_02755 [Myxococcota bacterium]
MLWLYGKVAAETGRRVVRSWPAVLALFAYGVILHFARVLTAPAGIIGGFIMGFVLAACFSSYLEIVSQALEGSRFKLDWEEFKRTFGARFWDVISVMFAVWILSFVTLPLMMGPHARALSAIIGFAMAFFFNAVPELIYQGKSRSFALLIESGRFVTEHPVAWLLPNVLVAALALWGIGALDVRHPVEFLILFGTLFSSPDTIVAALNAVPLWAKPIALIGFHAVMIFRGALFRELSSGGGNARLRAFRARMRG